MTSAERTKLKIELRQALSEALRQLREKLPHKPSQEFLAATVGMERSYWGDLERGERSLTLFNLWRMALALGVSPSRLVLAIDRNYRRISGLSEPAPRKSPMENAIKHLRDFMDQSPTMKWLGDGKRNCLYCNEPWLQYTGCSLEEVVGQRWRELLHPEDCEQYMAVSKKNIGRRQPFISKYRIRRADGKYVWIVQQATPQFTPKGIFVGFLGTLIEEPNGGDS